MLDSLFSIFLLTGALAAGNSKKKLIRIDGKVAGVPDGPIELRNPTGLVASCPLVHGQFLLEFDAAFPYDYHLLFPDAHRVPITIGKDRIFVEIDFTEDSPVTEVGLICSDKRVPSLLPCPPQ
ncbi:MAG: hypothetical protein LUD68_01770 [Rikenellaceae bacterium]|nr:hypothetical protein [Rikenellaceae bacterium]